MRLLDLLGEDAASLHAAISQRDVLFHASKRDAAAEILATDRLRASDHDAARESKGAGVSFTRSYAYAQAHRSTAKRGGVIMVLRASGLQTHPVAYWTPEERVKFGRADEMEEFHPGEVATLHRHLVSLNSSRPFSDWLAWVTETFSSKDAEQYAEPRTLALVRAQIELGFPNAAALWNRWQPGRGVSFLSH